MLVRIVKMTFDKTTISDFLSNFNSHKEAIREFKGCQLLELYRDKSNPTIFFTYSYWDSEADLDLYRKSELFENLWQVTKHMFSDKPQAWSVEKIVSLE